MQATSNIHHQIIKACLGVAEDVFDNPTAFDTANDMFHDDAYAVHNSVEESVCQRQLLTAGLLARLKGNHPFGFIALKTLVFVQEGFGGKDIHLFITDLLVALLAFIGLTEILHFPRESIDNDVVLAGVGLLLPAVVLLLLLRVTGALDSAFGAINHELQAITFGQNSLQVGWISLGQMLGHPQGHPQDLAQPMNPNVNLALADTEQQPQHLLQGIGLEVEQNEEQFVFRLRQDRFASPPVLALALFPLDEGLVDKDVP